MTSSAHRPERVRVGVFAKAPTPGQVKTRLAPLLGEVGAAALHAGLVRHALDTALRAAPAALELWCAPDGSDPFLQRCASDFGARLLAQEGGDLGARMAHAFSQAHAAGESLVLIGSDSPVLTPAHLREAIDMLREADAVLAPAEDGGYVLLGLSVPVPAIFEGVAWSTGAVMSQTRERLRGAGASWRELPTLWDVDRPDDYARLRREGLLEEVLS